MSFNPVTQAVAFKVTAGQTVLIRFDYQPNPQPLNSSGGGTKG